MGYSAFRKTGLTFHNPNLSVKGYTIFSPLKGDSTYLIDMAGRVVHRWQFDDMKPDLPHLLPSGNLLVAGVDNETSASARALAEDDFSDLNLHFRRLGGGYTTLREYDFDGNLLWSYDHPAMHHDFLVQDNGRLLIPLWVAIPEETARQVQGGTRRRKRNQPPMVGDDVVELERDGTETARWHIWQMFDPRRDPIRPLQRRLEWTHLNSIDLNPARQLLISCRNNSRVALVDQAKHEIVWKLGDPVVSHQHHATFVPGGNIQIYDNGMNRPESLSYSRIIEVNPDPGADTAGKDNADGIVWEYKANPADQFFSGHISGAQRLERGNVLICEGTSGRLFEVTRRGEVVWEWITPFVSGTPDGRLFTWIYRAYRYGLDHPAIAGRDLDPARYGQINRSLGLL